MRFGGQGRKKTVFAECTLPGRSFLFIYLAGSFRNFLHFGDKKTGCAGVERANGRRAGVQRVGEGVEDDMVFGSSPVCSMAAARTTGEPGEVVDFAREILIWGVLPGRRELFEECGSDVHGGKGAVHGR